MGRDLTRPIPSSRELPLVKTRALIYWQIGPNPVAWHVVPSRRASPIGQQIWPLCPQRQTGPYMEVIVHSDPSVHIVPPQHESPFNPHWQVRLAHCINRPHIVPPPHGCP